MYIGLAVSRCSIACYSTAFYSHVNMQHRMQTWFPLGLVGVGGDEKSVRAYIIVIVHVSLTLWGF